MLGAPAQPLEFLLEPVQILVGESLQIHQVIVRPVDAANKLVEL